MTTTCWSCGEAPGSPPAGASLPGDPGAGAFCARCGKVQPPRGDDAFAQLGLPRAFALDGAELERRYRDLQRKLHPDRFALGSPEERRASLLRTTDLNEAYRTLKDPAQRAAYLLELRGVTLPAGGGRGKTHPAEPSFLMEVLDLREALDEAKRANDLARVEALAAGVRARRDATLATIERALGAESVTDAVVPLLDQLKYFTRFLDEVTAIEEASLEAGH